MDTPAAQVELVGPWRTATLVASCIAGLELVLLVGSAVFHTHFAGPAGVLPIIALGALVYLAGLTRWRGPCYLGIAASCLALVYYKYTTFICTRVLVAAWPGAAAYVTSHYASFREITAPLAISFFVFDFVHYLVDVRRGDAPVRNPLNFALFTVFWPSIVAGPVKRYQQFLPALERGLGEVTRPEVAYGLIRVALGLVKKFAADNLTAYVNAFDGHFDVVPASTRWAARRWCRPRAIRIPTWSCAAATVVRTTMRKAYASPAKACSARASPRGSWSTAATPTAARTRCASRRYWKA